VTSTTHKTLRGPRSGIIMMEEALAKEVNSRIFPGIQGGPLMHIIAAKAVAFGEALDPSDCELQGSSGCASSRWSEFGEWRYRQSSDSGRLTSI